jgi:hypothetical protein
MATEADGQILVVDSNLGGVVRVDPTTGAQTLVTMGGFLGSAASPWSPRRPGNSRCALWAWLGFVIVLILTLCPLPARTFEPIEACESIVDRSGKLPGAKFGKHWRIKVSDLDVCFHQDSVEKSDRRRG